MNEACPKAPERVDRRWVLAGALALGACGYAITPNNYKFRTTEDAREPFFAAIRAFAEREGMEIHETEREVGATLFRQFLIAGWRSQITVSPDFDGQAPIPNQFIAYIASTHDAMPWALKGEALEDFAAAFESALASVPGVEVEHITFPVPSFQP